MTPESRETPSPIGGDTATLLVQPGAKGVLCAKCNHLNRVSASKCSRCEAHLYVKCNDCGTHTERVHTCCQSCGRRLHKSFFEKMNGRMFRQNARVTPLQVVLLLIFACVAFYCVMMIDRLKLPTITR